MSFIDDNTGYTASTRAVYKTTNFGISWDSVGRATQLNIDVTSIEFSNENTGWAGTASQINKTTNGGRNWFVQIITGVVYNIYSFSDSLVWTCGNAGRIWHTVNGGMSKIENLSSSITDNFELYQNYPNPFNSQTTILFEIAKKGIYKFEIFNTLGQKVEELFDENLSQGQYQIKYNAISLNSGVYIYRLSSAIYSSTKKFILLK